MRWVFAQRLAGYSVAGIARTLNARGVPSPSAPDPARNPHRSGAAWTLRTVAAILANPRCTGRQVWRRQRIDHHEVRPEDKSSRPRGSKPARCWNPREQWEFSPPGAHPALVRDADFLRVQQVSALPLADDGSTDRYQLTGIVICGLCGRRLEGHWAHGRARYRCRHGYTSASDVELERAKVLYVRQDQIVAQARVQYAHLVGVDPDDVGLRDLVRGLRVDGITIVCTPVSIILDAGGSPTRRDRGRRGRDRPTSSYRTEHSAAGSEKPPPKPSAKRE